MAHTHDHELKVGSTTDQFTLVKDDQGRAMYQIIEDTPQYQPTLRFTQNNWIGGHGQATYSVSHQYLEGQSIDTTVPGKLFLAPEITEVQEDNATELDGNPVVFCWFPAISKLMCATATNIYRLDAEGWDVCATAVTGVLQLKVLNGIIYAARGATGAYMYSSDGDAWTATDLTDSTAYGFLVAPNPAGTAENLWKFKTSNELSRTTDGRTTGAGGVQWESPSYIGDTAANITNIFLINDNLIVGKTDGLFQVDSEGGTHPLMADLKINRSADNFKYVSYWQTGTYFSLQRHGGEITSYNSYQPVHPLAEMWDMGKVGDTVGISADRDWIYWAVDEGTNTHIYKGREVRDSGQLMWQWCPWVFLGTNACATIEVVQHTTTDRRLWFGYGNKTGYVVLSDNPLGDSTARYTTSGWCRMSYVYGTDANWDKLWQSAVLEVERVASGAKTAASAGETVAVSYRDDADISSATALIAAATTVGVYESNFAAGGVAGTPINNKRVQFQLDLASDTSTATPVVTYFQAKGVEVPTTVRVHEAYYSVGDRPSDRAKTIRTLLRAARTTTSLIKFADLRYGQKTSGTASGDYVWCVMMPGFPKEVEVKHEKQRQPELAIQVRLMEISFTIS